MRKAAVIIAFAALVAGCNMANPGVQHIGAPLKPEDVNKTTYNSQWVNTAEPEPMDTLDHKQPLSADISKRQLGVRYLDEDTRIGEKGNTVPGWQKRQREREEARRKAWRERMGIKTVKDEQAERDD